VDPPYARAAELQAPLAELLPGVLAETGGRVAVESDRRAPLRLALTPHRERRYGDTLIAIYGNEA
jgi:16S rRNA G966 N2-methylase RsmD